MCDGFSEALLTAASVAGEGVETGLSTVGGLAAEYGGTAAAVGSAGMQAYSTYAQANAQQQAAQYQAQLARNNAQTAAYQRSAALQQGMLQTQQAMLQQAQVESGQRATLAANGVDLSSGSALDQLAGTRLLGQQDVNTIQSNAARAAWGYGVEAGNDLSQAQLSSWQARNNQPWAQGLFSGAGSLLSSASRYAPRNN